MGISYEQFKFTVDSGNSKVARITLPLNSTLKSASLRIVGDDEELIGLYNAGLYISNNYDISNERIFIPLDFGTISFYPKNSSNLGIDNLNAFLPFQSLGGFYNFEVKKQGMQLIAIVYHQSKFYTGSGVLREIPMDFIIYYEIEEPEGIKRRVRRRFSWEIILI